MVAPFLFLSIFPTNNLTTNALYQHQCAVSVFFQFLSLQIKWTHFIPFKLDKYLLKYAFVGRQSYFRLFTDFILAFSCLFFFFWKTKKLFRWLGCVATLLRELKMSFISVSVCLGFSFAVFCLSFFFSFGLIFVFIYCNTAFTWISITSHNQIYGEKKKRERCRLYIIFCWKVPCLYIGSNGKTL